MSTPDQRKKMARAIVDFEARRDRQGHLVVYQLPPADGGGRYEVAGINERYDKPVADKLVGLVEAGKYDEAENVADEYIAANTDPATKLTQIPSLESYLRDIVFNRGVTGATKTLQHALGTTMDGIVGPNTKAKMAEAEKDPQALLQKLRDAREWYERNVVHRDESSMFWKGLVNRWNKSLVTAKSFPDKPENLTRVATPAQPVPTAPTTPAPMQPAHQASWWVDTLERGIHALRKETPTPPPTPVPTIPIAPPKPVPAASSPELHDLGHRIKRSCLALGYTWFTGPGELNIVAVEGTDPDGKRNQNRSNYFEDIKCLVDGDGKIVGGPYEATTQPGKFWTQHRMNPGGAANITKGQQTAWQPGPYHDMDALREVRPITFTRDPNETFKRYGPVYTDEIGVHHHGGYNYPHDDMGRSSAGCQVIRLMDKHAEFMKKVRQDPRHVKDPEGFVYTATVLLQDELLD